MRRDGVTSSEAHYKLFDSAMGLVDSRLGHFRLLREDSIEDSDIPVDREVCSIRRFPVSKRARFLAFFITPPSIRSNSYSSLSETIS